VTDLLAGRAQMGTSLGVGLPALIAAAHFAGLAATTRSGSASPSRSRERSPSCNRRPLRRLTSRARAAEGQQTLAIEPTQ
jgi:hypothetical protein